jgi:hypothetical protein
MGASRSECRIVVVKPFFMALPQNKKPDQLLADRVLARFSRIYLSSGFHRRRPQADLKSAQFESYPLADNLSN